VDKKYRPPCLCSGPPPSQGRQKEGQKGGGGDGGGQGHVLICSVVCPPLEDTERRRQTRKSLLAWGLGERQGGGRLGRLEIMSAGAASPHERRHI
jgi:hypothetical protein